MCCRGGDLWLNMLIKSVWLTLELHDLVLVDVAQFLQHT
jgi:hypothetical protein